MKYGGTPKDAISIITLGVYFKLILLNTFTNNAYA